MFLDDLDPKKKTPQAKNLDPLSIDELRDYIAELEGEIGRAQNEIARKTAQRASADAFFKGPGA